MDISTHGNSSFRKLGSRFRLLGLLTATWRLILKSLERAEMAPSFKGSVKGYIGPKEDYLGLYWELFKLWEFL